MTTYSVFCSKCKKRIEKNEHRIFVDGKITCLPCFEQYYSKYKKRKQNEAEKRMDDIEAKLDKILVLVNKMYEYIRVEAEFIENIAMGITERHEQKEEEK